MVLAHKKGYLNHKVIMPGDNYVYDAYHSNDSIQTKFINDHF